ncbi:MAG TPA: hypothetical protein VNL92_04955, partial [Dehalococcoidia bacterium]|nr:hypothetical protein [Dehalococcoidia bacterium]
ATRGLRFSKVISFGNALDLNEADFLEYFAADPETELVAVYLEGVQKGPRMFHALRSLAQRKPVVLLKGGATEAGSRAAASHTGSLAGAARVWQALARQSNAIAVDSIEEVCDQLVALQALPHGLSGNRAAIIGSGGGTSVLAADACAREGIDVPALPGDVQERLLEFTPLAGNSVRNPLDTFAITERDNFVRTVRIVGEAENIDFILLHTHAGWGFRQMTPGEALEQTIAGILASREATTKPVLVVLREPMSAEQAEPWMQLRTRCSAEGVPVFNGIERAARALSRVVEWHEQRGELASQAG